MEVKPEETVMAKIRANKKTNLNKRILNVDGWRFLRFCARRMLVED